MQAVIIHNCILRCILSRRKSSHLSIPEKQWHSAPSGPRVHYFSGMDRYSDFLLYVSHRDLKTSDIICRFMRLQRFLFFFYLFFFSMSSKYKAHLNMILLFVAYINSLVATTCIESTNQSPNDHQFKHI